MDSSERPPIRSSPKVSTGQSVRLAQDFSEVALTRTPSWRSVSARNAVPRNSLRVLTFLQTMIEW